MRRLLIFPLVILLAACGGSGATPTIEVTPTVTATPTAEATSPTTASPTAGEASPVASVEAAMSITGQLSGDDIEGGCVFVTAEDGTNYEVIWPEGWGADFETLELTNPDGEVVAEAGDEITVHGDVAEGMSSICQIGPIFEAVEVDVAD